MAIPQMTAFTEMPTYLVYRDVSPGKPFDPTSPLAFLPEKGSDELFDALRVAFPHVRSHSERMREAVIKFLLEEQQIDQVQPSPATTMDSMPSMWPSMSSETASLFDSPHSLNLAHPASLASSPQLQAPQLTRQGSSVASSQSSPPTLDAMTGVFSLSTSSQPKQRVRRKMTEAEKVEYRKRRIVKACDKCARRKRKCPHNQAQMETISMSKSSARARKATSPKSAKSAVPPSAVQPAIMIDQRLEGDFVFDPASFGPFEDFNMFEDLVPEFDINQFVDFDQQKYGSDLFTPDVSPLQTSWIYDESILHNQMQHNSPVSAQSSMNSRSSSNDRLHESSNSSNGCSSGGNHTPDHLGGSLSSQDEWYASASQSLTGDCSQQAHQQLDREDRRPDDHGMLWETLRTGQLEKPVPTHMAHVHDAAGGGPCGPHDTIGGIQATRLATLPQIVLRLTGTAKAIRAFTGSLSRPRTTTQLPVSVERASQAAINSYDGGLMSETRASDLRTQTSSASLPGVNAAHSRMLVNGSSTDQATRAPPQLQQSEDGFSLSTDQRGTPVIDRGRDEVTANPRTDPSQEQSQMGRSRGPSFGVNRRTRPAANESTLTSVSVSLADGSPRSTSSRERRQQMMSVEERSKLSLSDQTALPRTSLGEGIPDHADASLDLYMARKRVSRQRHRHSGFDRAKLKSSQVSPANGGAYLRLLQNKASSSTSAVLEHGHTQARDSVTSDCSAEKNQYHGTGTGTVPREGATVAFSRSAIAGSTSTNSIVHEERLSDHVRYRDHHGRVDENSCSKSIQSDRDSQYHGDARWSFAQALVASLIALVLSSMLSASMAVTPTFLMLAFVYPLQFSNGERDLDNETSDLLCDTMVQCTAKNSAWLSKLLPNRGFSAHKLTKICGSKGYRMGNAVWLTGLRYPHALSPAVAA